MSEPKLKNLPQPEQELTANQAEEAQGGIGEQYGLRASAAIINSLEFKRPAATVDYGD
jgi:hypothetical protein